MLLWGLHTGRTCRCVCVGRCMCRCVCTGTDSSVWTYTVLMDAHLFVNQCWCVGMDASVGMVMSVCLWGRMH